MNSFSADSNSIFNLREFSFTLQNDVYVRYQSFTSQQEFEKELIKMNPYKIDIGAIYNHPVSIDYTIFVIISGMLYQA